MYVVYHHWLVPSGPKKLRCRYTANPWCWAYDTPNCSIWMVPGTVNPED